MSVLPPEKTNVMSFTWECTLSLYRNSTERCSPHCKQSISSTFNLCFVIWNFPLRCAQVKFKILRLTYKALNILSFWLTCLTSHCFPFGYLPLLSSAEALEMDPHRNKWKELFLCNALSLLERDHTISYNIVACLIAPVTRYILHNV